MAETAQDQTQLDVELDAVVATSQALTAASERAIAQAKSALAEDAALFERHGLRPDSGRQFLKGMGDEVVAAADEYLARDRADFARRPPPETSRDGAPRRVKPRMMV